MIICCIYFHVFMPSELLNLNAAASFHLQLPSSLWLWQHSLISSDDLMVVNGISPSATLLDFVKWSHYFELLDQWLIFRDCSKCWGVMLLVADDDVTH